MRGLGLGLVSVLLLGCGGDEGASRLDVGDADDVVADVVEEGTEDGVGDGDDGSDASDSGDATDVALGEFSWRIDDGIVALADLEHPLIGTRPVGAVVEDGLVMSYVEDEMIVPTRDAAVVAALVERWNGEVLFDDVVPEPPPELDVTLSEEARRPTMVVVRVDTSAVDLDMLSSRAPVAGVVGDVSFSSEEMARLWGALAEERAGGLEVAPNMVFEPMATPMVFQTNDGNAWSPGPGVWTTDAFDYTQFDRNGQWTRSEVTRAWQLLFANTWSEDVAVAVIDGGFWLDGSGNSVSATAGVSDFPFHPVQWDFWDEDGTAGGGNPNNCTGGSACPWHGNNCASVATAEPDNGYGAAGTGGWVASPWMFRFGFDNGGQWWALRTAIEWGADVVSMSYGGSCSTGCQVFSAGLFAKYRSDADARDVVLVAAAGNDNRVVDDGNSVVPCLFAICVGALNDTDMNRISYSNWGPHVDVFAPTNVPATPNPASGGALVSAGGTSASTPFVAGVAAMMKAVAPGLNTTDVETILRTTARTDSPDSRVPRTVDAYEALLAALDGRIRSDFWEPDDTQGQAVDGGSGPTILLSPRTDDDGGDFDWVRFTVGDWSRLRVELDYMPPLGDFHVNFHATEGGHFAWGSLPIRRADGADWVLSEVNPGEYRILVTGDGPSVYDQTIRITAVPLQPDVFEVNDTPANASAPSSATTHDLTLHTMGDVDVHRVVVQTLSVALHYQFQIVDAAFPVDVSIAATSAPGTVLWQALATTATKVTLDPGDYLVTIRPRDRTTRYKMRTGVVSALDGIGEALELEPDFFVIGPSPIEGWLLGMRDALVFVRTRDLTRFDTVRVRGAGIDASLLATDATVLDEGAALDDSLAERMTIPAGVDTVVVLLTRIDQSPVPEGVAIPALPYTIEVSASAR